MVPRKPYVEATQLTNPLSSSSSLTEPDVVRVSMSWILCVSEKVAHSSSSKPAAQLPLVIPLTLPVKVYEGYLIPFWSMGPDGKSVEGLLEDFFDLKKNAHEDDNHKEISFHTH